jgi:hypothetical protein
MTPVSLLPYVVWRIEVDGQGAVAQLGERLICIQEVAGSIPTSSTSFGALVVGRAIQPAAALAGGVLGLGL